MNLVKSIFGKLITPKYLILLVIILALGWFGWTKFLNKSTAQPTYQTAMAEKGSLVSSVTASGTISQGSSFSITTQASGVVKNVYVQNGDSVKTGQKIADLTLDTASLQKQTAAWASYLSAKNSLASAQNSLNSLNSTMWSVQQKLINDSVDRGLTTYDPTYIQQNSDWLAAENAYKNQQAIITASQTSLSSSWLSYIQLSPTITSPSSGIISGLTLTPGLPVTNSTSTSSTTSTPSVLGTVTLESSTPQATVNLTEIDVVKVKQNQKVTLTLDALEGKTFTGVVSSINTNGSVSSGVSTYPTTITFDTNVSTIYPNMGVNATIITNVKNDLILVPSAAVQTNNGQSSVTVMKNGVPSIVSVEVGDSNDTQTEIISGINEGDTVVTGQTNTNSSTGTTTSPFGNTRGGVGGFGGGNAIRGR